MSELSELFAKGCELQALKQYQQAIEVMNKVLLIEPNHAPAWNNRGAMLLSLGFPFDAAMNFDRAIQVVPDASEFFNNRGAAYLDMHYMDKARADFARSLELAPITHQPHNNMGNAFMRDNRVAEAVESFRACLALQPDYAEAHLGLALALLKLGQYEEGFKEFIWRWETEHLNKRFLPYPDWDGKLAKSPDDTLLIYGEQGLGDDLNFMRYAPIAKKIWGGKVTLEIRQPLVRVAQTMLGIDSVIALTDRPPLDTKAVAPLINVPHLIWDQYPYIPSNVPYLFSDEYRVGIWKERLKECFARFGDTNDLLVGICWSGMSRKNQPGAVMVDKFRSMHLNQFAPLTAIKGIKWVCLQLGEPKEQIKNAPTGMTIADLTEDLYDFSDTAALIEALDLVITVDTSVAHVAGAIGKPVWMLSRFDGCWRWGIQKKTTHWYPTMRIFCQPKRLDWDTPLEEIRQELHRITTQRMLQGVAA